MLQIFHSGVTIYFENFNLYFYFFDLMVKIYLMSFSATMEQKMSSERAAWETARKALNEITDKKENRSDSVSHLCKPSYTSFKNLFVKFKFVPRK